MSEDKSLITVKQLTKYFPVMQGVFIQRKTGDIQAVDEVTLDILQGETIGLVGESGCGKSTLGRTILQLYRPTSGQVFFQDIEITQLERNELRKFRRRMQMIFQDPFASLNPRMTVGRIVAEPLRVHGVGNAAEQRERVQELLQLAGLNPDFVSRYPHEFSGGQRQRIGIARALALQPDFIILDEPISALDVSIQAQVVNLLQSLQEQFSLTYLFIAHDLSMVRHISHRIAVMYLGKLVELAARDELFSNALHPYTQALLSAVPIPKPKLERSREQTILEGDVPNPANPPSGCRFHPRCPIAEDVCSKEVPEWREVKSGHWVACHLV